MPEAKDIQITPHFCKGNLLAECYNLPFDGKIKVQKDCSSCVTLDYAKAYSKVKWG